MIPSKLSLGDRYSEIAVALLTLVALLAGWLTMNRVQSRALPFQADGVSASVPSGWIQSEPGSDVILQARERASSGFQTNYTITRQLTSADGGQNEAVSLLTLQYGQELTAFRILGQQAVTVNGREAIEIAYAYVESDPNVSHAGLPVVVRGADTIFLTDQGAIIVSYRASEAEY
ncbi:MAG: hypothetical protein COS37_04905, partial [Anaerolineae bacterium CG03_land_8_20_14_0_80_58_20]